MSSVVVSGNTSGTVTLEAPAVAGTVTVTLPSATGTMLTSASTITPSDGSVTPAKMSGAQTGSAPAYAARAWVNFNGTGTVAIRASGNVSSITDILTGEYGINFTTAMPDADYATLATCGNSSSVNGAFLESPVLSAPSTSAVKCAAITHAGSIVDMEYVSIAIFR